MLASWRESGLPRIRFCQREGIPLTSFCGWEKQERKSREAAVQNETQQQPEPTRQTKKKVRKKKPTVPDPSFAQDMVADFVQVNVGADIDHGRPGVTQEFIEISCPSGVLIKLPPQMDTDKLLALLTTLAG